MILTKCTISLLVILVAFSAVSVGLLIALLRRRDTQFCAEQVADTGIATSTMTELQTSPTPVPYLHYRLSRNVLPVSYDLYLHPNLVTDVFQGRVAVTVNVTAPTDQFVLHEKSLNITETIVKRDDEQKTPISIKDAFSYPENEFWIIALTSEVEPGTYTLYLNFNGSLVNGIVGFYKSVYFNEITGQKRALATSKFEPTYARKAFPCFDEPNMKATFKITIAHDEDYMALSNMPPVGTKTRQDGLLETEFQSSVVMSTYLVCFIVCDFKHKSTTTKDGKKFSVYATPSQVDNVDYAVNAGKIVQDYYSEYYGIPYPLPKQDMIAIPDFVSGAMEHWGLITYRETALLYDPKESPVQSQERVATVIAHELAHQWFGNLVTMDWWDDLWLNEGFADYLEYIGSGKIEPTWNMPEATLILNVQDVMKLDAGSGTHPIIQPVNNPDEITEIFDAISYSKGSSVIRMLDSFMGTDDFRKGLQSYLKKNSYGNAKTSDLWKELSTASSMNLNIGAIMDTWTKQMGFPVINVTRNPTKPSEFTVTQQRFYLLPDAAQNMNRSESPFGYLWHVPLTFYQPDKSIETVWINGVEKLSFEIPWATKDVIKFNVNQFGFYKVNYDDDSWNSLSKQLQEGHTNFSRMDRAHLLNDALTLASGGYLNYSVALNITKYLSKETDYLPWAAVSSELTDISIQLQSTATYQYFRTYMIKLLMPLYNSLGWKDEGDHLTRKLRSLILLKLCQSDYQDVLNETGRRLQMWLNGEFLPPNFRSIVYRYGISGSQGGPEVWDAVWNKYLNTTLASERNLLLNSLAYAKQPWIIHRFLQYAEDENLVRRQDYFNVLGSIAQNPLGTGILWDYYRSNYEKLIKRFTLNDRSLGKVIVPITQRFSEEIRLQEMLDFFAKYPNAGAGTRARKQSLDTVRQNIDWVKRYEETIRTWLSQNV